MIRSRFGFGFVICVLATTMLYGGEIKTKNKSGDKISQSVIYKPANNNPKTVVVRTWK